MSQYRTLQTAGCATDGGGRRTAVVARDLRSEHRVMYIDQHHISAPLSPIPRQERDIARTTNNRIVTSLVKHRLIAKSTIDKLRRTERQH